MKPHLFSLTFGCLLMVQAFFCLPCQAGQMELPTDSTSESFRATQLILPASLIAVGALGVDNGMLCALNEDVNDGMQRLSGGHTTKVDEYLRFVPMAAYLGLGSMGVKCRHGLTDRVMISATATAALLATAKPVKRWVGERRPGGVDEFDSFPSGHVALSFMGAELLRNDYPTIYGIGGYAVACGVAFLRLYNNRHWTNDVVAGAGFGILSARVGIWMQPVWRNLIGKKNTDQGKSLSVMPVINPESSTMGLSAVVLF